MASREVTDKELSAADRAQVHAALKAWQANGEPNPLIPCDLDVDGDGTTDAFGLDPDGKLVFITQVNLDDTVFRSDGSGIEQGVTNG